jgi:hypothetical protein
LQITELLESLYTLSPSWQSADDIQLASLRMSHVIQVPRVNEICGRSGGECGECCLLRLQVLIENIKFSFARQRFILLYYYYLFKIITVTDNLTKRDTFLLV